MKSRQQGKIVYKVLGVIVGLAFMGYGIQERLELASIQKNGKHATVEPIANYTEFNRRGSTTYTAEFHFKTEDGRQIVAKHSFPEEVLADFQASKPVEVVYLPNDPNTFVFAKQEPSWFLVLGGAALGIAAAIFA